MNPAAILKAPGQEEQAMFRSYESTEVSRHFAAGHGDISEPPTK